LGEAIEDQLGEEDRKSAPPWLCGSICVLLLLSPSPMPCSDLRQMDDNRKNQDDGANERDNHKRLWCAQQGDKADGQQTSAHPGSRRSGFGRGPPSLVRQGVGFSFVCFLVVSKKKKRKKKKNVHKAPPRPHRRRGHSVDRHRLSG
jgi:hypothetical protein